MVREFIMLMKVQEDQSFSFMEIILHQEEREVEAQADKRSSGLMVFVNLYLNKRDSAELCVYSYEQDLGCDRINLSGYASPIQWGPWTFGSEAVKVGSEFTVCITNLISQERECSTGINGSAKKPEYVYLTMPGKKYSCSNDDHAARTDPYLSIPSLSSSRQQYSINWKAVCNTFDVFIVEPCNTLAHGTKLTPLG
jgi:hypothetical protein